MDAPTSHVDLVPTLLGAAGIDVAAVTETLRESFTEVHPLPGRNLMPVVDGASADADRAVYLMTRDNVARETRGLRAGTPAQADLNPPPPLRIRIPAHTAANFEGLVAKVDETAAPGGSGHLWKLVRSFDDPSTWTEPGCATWPATVSAARRTGPARWMTSGALRPEFRSHQSHNRWDDPDLHELGSICRRSSKHARPNRFQNATSPGRTPRAIPAGTDPARAALQPDLGQRPVQTAWAAWPTSRTCAADPRSPRRWWRRRRARDPSAAAPRAPSGFRPRRPAPVQDPPAGTARPPSRP